MDEARTIRLGACHSLRFLLLLGCAGISHGAFAAGAQPAGGHYVAGAGGIATSGATTTITQSSKRGVIDWHSFSVGKGNEVQFDNGNGATLNRVTGGSLSAIAGRLSATGSVYLINPNGLVVQAGGKVVTGGNFVATTRDADNSQFMAGGAQTFSGTSNGAVVNDGAIVSQDGSVALIGHAVTNTGSIDAAKGTASLSAGDTVVLTDASGPDGVYVAAGASGDTTNSGRIKAAAVALASAGGNVYALAGNRTGLIQATGTKMVDGQVWLTAGAGTLDVGGKVAATDADGSGGTISAKGDTLKLARGAVLNAAGRTGHGKIETSGNHVSIGKVKVTAGRHGDWLVDPVDLTIDSTAATTISNTLGLGTSVLEQTTSSTVSGSGNQAPGNGDIIVNSAIIWNSPATLTLSAFNDLDINAAITGGGTGGLVLTAGGSVNIDSPLVANAFSATAGASGMITVHVGAPVSVSTSGGGQTYHSAVMLVTDTGTFNETGNGTITFDGTVDADHPSFEALVVNAGTSGAAVFKGPVGGTNKLVGFQVTGAITLDGNVTTNGNQTYTGPVTLGGAVTMITLTSVDFTSTVDGGFGLVVNAPLDEVTLGGAIGGSAPLTSLSVTAGTVLTVGGDIKTTGALALSQGGSGTTLSLNHNLTATGSTITLSSAGPLVQGAGTIFKTDTLTGSSVNGATLTGMNAVSTFNFTNVDTGPLGDLSFTDTIPVTVSGADSTNNITLTTLSGAGMTLTGTVHADVNITLNSAGTIVESGSGNLNVGAILSGSSVGGAMLNKNNAVDTFENFSNTGGGDISFTNLAMNAVVGGVSGIATTGGGDLTLTGPGIELDGTLTVDAGKTMTLNSTGVIVQDSGAIITAGTLTGTSVGGATLTQGNAVDFLGEWADTGTLAGFSFKNGQALGISGPVSSTGDLTLTTTTGNLTIGDDVTANSGILTLTSAGTIGQSGGKIGTAALLVNSAGSVSLLGANMIHLLAADVTGAGATFAVNNTAQDLTVGSVGGVSGVTTDNGNVTLRTTTSGIIELAKPVDAGSATAKIAASGNLAIDAGGSVTAGAGATLATLGNFTNNAGAGAISVGSGNRWLVYSSEPSTDTDGGLTPAFMQYAASYTVGTLSGTAAAASGNGFLYSAAPTITLTGVTKIYDGTTSLPTTASDYTLSGAVSGDVVTLGVGGLTGSYANRNAGSVDVSASGLTVTATRGGIQVFGYAVGAVSNKPIGTITRATLTVGLTGTASKTYDGTTDASLTGANYTLTGLIGGDHVTVTAGSAAYASANAGDGIGVTASGLTLSGAQFGNYVLAGATATGNIGKITPATLTAGLTGTVGKTADGTTAATLTAGNYTLSGLIGGDTVMLNDPTSGSYATAQPGSGIAVTVGGLALLGAGAGNYRLATATVTGDIGTITAPTVPPVVPSSAAPATGVGTNVVPVVAPAGGTSSLIAGAGNGLGQLPAIVKKDAPVTDADGTVLSSGLHPSATPVPMVAPALASGCANEDMVAVLPEANGHVGAVVVESGGNKTLLNSAYASCSGSKPGRIDPQLVKNVFGAVLAARPTPPAKYELFCKAGSVALVPSSLDALTAALAEIKRRTAADVVVTGFADTTGKVAQNDILSLARAKSVAKQLQEHGVAANAMKEIGRGERDLLVPTKDQVAEEKNRRIEITVR